MTRCIWTSYFLTNKRNIFTFLFAAFQLSDSYFSAFFSANRNENINLDFQAADPGCGTVLGTFFSLVPIKTHTHTPRLVFSSDRALMFIYNKVCISRSPFFSPSEEQEIGVCLTWQIRVALTQVGSSKPTHFDRTGFINNVHQFLLCQCKCISSTTGFHLFYPECLRIMNKS